MLLSTLSSSISISSRKTQSIPSTTENSTQPSRLGHKQRCAEDPDSEAPSFTKSLQLTPMKMAGQSFMLSVPGAFGKRSEFAFQYPPPFADSHTNIAIAENIRVKPHTRPPTHLGILGKLPPELRSMIYDNITGDLTRPLPKHSFDHAHSFDLSITRTSWALRSEAQDTIYNTHFRDTVLLIERMVPGQVNFIFKDNASGEPVVESGPLICRMIYRKPSDLLLPFLPYIRKLKVSLGYRFSGFARPQLLSKQGDGYELAGLLIDAMSRNMQRLESVEVVMHQVFVGVHAADSAVAPKNVNRRLNFVYMVMRRVMQGSVLGEFKPSRKACAALKARVWKDFDLPPMDKGRLVFTREAQGDWHIMKIQLKYLDGKVVMTACEAPHY